jgi:alanine racemase
MLRKTYAAVDLDCIAHNIRELKRAARTQVMAVVKANAYGHGMRQVAAKAEQEGVFWFAVATADEAVELRKTCNKHILLLSAAEDEETVNALIEAEISQCVYTMRQLKLLYRLCEAKEKKANIHIKIDTGMNRIGLRNDAELITLLKFLKKQSRITLEGMFTHFATADEADKHFTGEQLKRFKHAVQIAREYGFNPLCHASNSAATIEAPEAHFDLCRMGISMYGYAPSEEVKLNGLNLKPALSLISHITYVKTIEEGESVSYGRKFTAEQSEQIATVAIGYADGYMRAFSGKAEAELGKQKIRSVGRICMDQCMFLVTGTGAQIGDEVRLIGSEITAESLAKLAGTISYEILTNLSARVPRVYLHA